MFTRRVLNFYCHTVSLKKKKKKKLRTKVAPWSSSSSEAYLLELHHFAVKSLWYFTVQGHWEERNPRNIEWWICSLSAVLPSSRLLPQTVPPPYESLSLYRNIPTQPKTPPSSVSSSTTAQALDIDIYLFLIWHIIIIGPLPRSSSPMWWFEEHSDVSVYQTSRAVSPMIFFFFCTYCLSLESYTVQLHTSEHKNITWDWMWCSSYRREKKKKALLLYRSLCHIYFIWFFFKDIYYSILLLFTYVFFFFWVLFCFSFIYLGYLAKL